MIYEKLAETFDEIHRGKFFIVGGLLSLFIIVYSNKIFYYQFYAYAQMTADFYYPFFHYAMIILLVAAIAVLALNFNYLSNVARHLAGSELNNEYNSSKLWTHFIKYPLLLIGFIVSLFAAGGVVAPSMNFLINLGLSQNIAYPIVVFGSALLTFAWFNLYVERKTGILSVFTTAPEAKSDSTPSIPSKAANILGWLNALLANTTGLAIGAIGVFTYFTPGISSAPIALKVFLVAIAIIGGFFAAAALTRKSLVKFFQQLEHPDSRATLWKNVKSPLGALKLLAVIVTSIGVAAFNFKAALYFAPQVTQFVFNSSIALNVGFYALAGIAGVLTFLSVAALLIDINFLQKKSDNSTNDMGWVKMLILYPSALLCDSLQSVMLYDAVKSILPKAAIGPLARQIISASFALLGAVIFFDFFVTGLSGISQNFSSSLNKADTDEIKNVKDVFQGSPVGVMLKESADLVRNC